MSESVREATERPCIDCGEPTFNKLRCRDCDIDYVIEQSRCQACGWQGLNAFGRELFGIDKRAHDEADACPWVAL